MLELILISALKNSVIMQKILAHPFKETEVGTTRLFPKEISLVTTHMPQPFETIN